MSSTRKSRSVTKRYTCYNEVSPVKHVEGAYRKRQQKRKSRDMLGPQWSKEELEHFYNIYRKHGKDWEKVAAVMRNRSIEMVEALYTMNRAYLSLPEGTASVAGLVAMMTAHYSNLNGSDNEQSNDGLGTTQSPQKCGRRITQLKMSQGSHGSPSHAVGKRTSHIPVSYCYENVNGQEYLSPTQHGTLKEYADNDEVMEIAKTLTEVSHAGGSPQVSLTPKGMVGSHNMDEDGIDENLETDNGDLSGTKSFRLRNGRCYGNKAEAVCSGNNHLDEIWEACCETEGRMLDAGDIISGAEVVHGRRKRDEGPDLHALEILADCSLMPEMTDDKEASVQFKDKRNDDDEAEFVGAMPETFLEDEYQLSVVVTENHSVSRLQHADNKTSGAGKVPVDNIPEAVACGDIPISAPWEAEGKSVEKMILDKGKRESQSASLKVLKQSENSSTRTGPRKEGGDSAIPTGGGLVSYQVDTISKGSRKRKMNLKKHQEYASLTSLGKTDMSQPVARFTSLYDGAPNLELANHTSNHQARRWCSYEWFYSAIDYPWFAKNEFVEYLYHVGLGHVPRLTRVEWGVIRSSLGKPRRFSVQFLKEEKEKLNLYRNSVRRHYAELRQGSREGLPTDLARPLSVGQRVIAFHPKAREVHDGSVLTVEPSKCLVQFDRPELGVGFVMDIDCMPANPVENLPTSLSSHIDASDNYRKKLHEFKLNGQRNNQRTDWYLISNVREDLENCNRPSNMWSNYPFHNAIKPPMMASSFVSAQPQMIPRGNPINQHTVYSQSSLHAEVQAEQAVFQAIVELTRAIEKKNTLLLEWKELNNDGPENEKDGESDLKDLDPYKKQYGAVVTQLQKANEQVLTALYHLRQRNLYHDNLILSRPRPVTNMSDIDVDSSSFNCFDNSKELRTHVSDIVERSRLRASMMVNSAIQVYASIKRGGNTIEKIEEAIDIVNIQLSVDYSKMPAEGSIRTAEARDMSSHELLKPKLSSLPQPSSEKLKNPPLPSELITKCVSTLLMIQRCTERQLPPEDVAQVMDFAVTSLRPSCSQNLPIYADIEKCMIMIKNQIMARVPT